MTFRLAVTGAIALLIAACAGDPKTPPACPNVLVLADAATLTAFAPGRGTDVLDIDYEVEIADVLSGCKVDRSDKSNPVLTVAVAPILLVNRGNANADGSASFAYFVSVINQKEAIANKVDFPIQVKFEGNRNRMLLREDDPPVTVNLPMSVSVNPFDYEVVVGMQLTPQQLAHNQSLRAGGR